MKTLRPSFHPAQLALPFLAVFIVLLLTGCAAPGEGRATPTAVATPAATLNPQAVSWSAWQSGPHADTYALEKGPNTYCAACHSPANWDPEAVIDPPPNCVSCKFPTEPEPRIAAGNPLVPESEWASIGCEVCHREVNGIYESQISWWNTVTGFHETVSNTTELCEKCHLNRPPFLQHQRVIGDQAHAGFTCTQCHNAHTGYSNCRDCHGVSLSQIARVIPEHAEVNSNDDCEACHPAAWGGHNMMVRQAGNDDCMSCHGYLMGSPTLTNAQVAHSEFHKMVTCIACHDASGLDVQPDEETGFWWPYRTLNIPVGSVEEPYQSHQLSRSVRCDRCHFEANPWSLSLRPLE